MAIFASLDLISRTHALCRRNSAKVGTDLLVAHGGEHS